jgi:Major Facilitator Superfamily
LLVALAVPYQPGLNNDEKYVAQLREGFLFLLRSPLLRAVTFTVTITNFLDAIAAIALPVFANQVFGDSLSLGLLLGASGGGAVVGALIYARFGREVSRRTVFGCGFVGSVIWYPILALFPPLGVAVAAKAVSGLGAGPLNPIFDTLLYERVPSGMRGRVLGAVVGAAWVGVAPRRVARRGRNRGHRRPGNDHRDRSTLPDHDIDAVAKSGDQENG